jgi:hypothetical protein
MLSQISSEVMANLEEQHKQKMGSIQIMQDNFIPVPKAIQQLSNRLSTVVVLGSELSSLNGNTRHISDNVEKTLAISKGWSRFRRYK